MSLSLQSTQVKDSLTPRLLRAITRESCQHEVTRLSLLQDISCPLSEAARDPSPLQEEACRRLEATGVACLTEEVLLLLLN